MHTPTSSYSSFFNIQVRMHAHKQQMIRIFLFFFFWYSAWNFVLFFFSFTFLKWIPTSTILIEIFWLSSNTIYALFHFLCLDLLLYLLLIDVITYTFTSNNVAHNFCWNGWSCKFLRHKSAPHPFVANRRTQTLPWIEPLTCSLTHSLTHQA